MSVSLGIFSIALLFIYIIIPGFISRRFYFHGEFSKQINIAKAPILQLVYSSFAGLTIIFAFISILNCSDDISINFDKTLKSFQHHFLEQSTTPDNKTVSITDDNIIGKNINIYKIYLPFLIGLYIFSILIGYFLCKLIIILRWDTKYKFFRFNNEWHYIFSGKIFHFKKYSFEELNSGLEVKYTYIDVLTINDSDKPKLYSGLLADYDLNRDDNSKIERIHLLKASRYKFIRETDTVIQRNIPGNIFTILGSRIININCIYVFYDPNEISIKKYNTNRKYLYYAQLLTTFIFGLFFAIIIAKINFPNHPVLNEVLSKNVWYRLTVIFTVNVFLGFFTPFKIDRAEKKIAFIGLHNIFLKLILIVVLVFALYLYY